MTTTRKRTAGRPPIAEGEASQQINVRLTASQVDWLDDQSRRAGHSGRNAVLRRLIDEAKAKTKTT